MKKHRLFFHFSVCLLVMATVSLFGDNALNFDPEETRKPWMPEDPAAMRDWLISDLFPASQENSETPDIKIPPNSRLSLEFDYFSDYGGESQLSPSDKDQFQRLDGSLASWKNYRSNDDIIDFIRIFEEQDTVDKVVFAYREIESEKDQSAWLTFGSDDGVVIYLNGERIYTLAAYRAMTPDQDLVAINLKKGKNRLLVKIDNGSGGFAFSMRLFHRLPSRDIAISPQIISTESSNLLKIRLRYQGNKSAAAAASIEVTVVGTGGQIIARKIGQAGDIVAFDSVSLKEGPYSIRTVTRLFSGEKRVHHQPWYKGNMMAALIKLVQTADGITSENLRVSESETLIYPMLASLVRDRLGGDPREGQVLPSNLYSEMHAVLMEYIELGIDPVNRRGQTYPYGFLRLAWRDPVDNSPQFCRVYLPGNYRKEEKWPLLAMLHGYNPENPEYINWWDVSKRNDLRSDSRDIVLIEPHGRGNTGYRGMGEDDVMRAIAQSERLLSIDPDRIYLTGYSMGGGGTWEVGTRHTNRFAAIAPVYGGWDYHIYLNSDVQASLTPGNEYYLKRDSSFVQAENLLHTPIYLNHGTDDQSVSVNFTRYAACMLQRWGYTIQYWEHPGEGHNNFGEELPVVDWLLQNKRVSHPRQVRLRSAWLRSARSFWLYVTARESQLDFINATGKWEAPNTFVVESDNASQIKLDLREMVAPGETIEVIWNGIHFTAPTNGNSVAILPPKLESSAKINSQRIKTSLQEGPMSAVANKPFAIVYGTLNDSVTGLEERKRAANRLADYWKQEYKYNPRLFSDRELTPTDMAGYSLILIGGPGENSISNQMAKELLLSVEGKKYIIDGREFDAPDSVACVVQPHPKNNSQLLLLCQANLPSAYEFLNFRLFTEYDYCISTGQDTNIYEGQFPEQINWISGYFNSQWAFEERFLFWGDETMESKTTGGE